MKHRDDDIFLLSLIKRGFLTFFVIFHCCFNIFLSINLNEFHLSSPHHMPVPNSGFGLVEK